MGNNAIVDYGEVLRVSDVSRIQLRRVYEKKFGNVMGIYALTDPEDKTVHYVGRSIHIVNRYFEHVPGYLYSRIYLPICQSKDNWVTMMKAKGIHPALILLEECEEKFQSYREWLWIRHLAQSQPLTNNGSVGRWQYQWGIGWKNYEHDMMLETLIMLGMDKDVDFKPMTYFPSLPPSISTVKYMEFLEGQRREWTE